MSGICGICENARNFGVRAIAPMLEQLTLPGEMEPAVCGGGPAVMGIARRWNFQGAASFGGVSVVADADLVNRAAAVRALSSPVDNSSEPSAAALIARLYVERGMDFLKSLHGAFSMGLWDESRQRLILAIDPVGIKSVFWRRERNRLLFASRISAIRAAQESPVEVNSTAVLQFLLFSAVPAPLAIDKGTEKLQPGTFLIFEGGTISTHTYWDLQYPEDKESSVSHWAQELREGMRSAVYRHLESCESMKTGCYLSGGTDSSSVVAFASEKQQPVQSFSIAFDEAGFSEIEFARTAAARFATRHYEKVLKPQDAAAVLDKLVDFYDEPFANSSAIGSYYCALLAREKGVDTLLAGDGGDELFGGNERYAHDKLFALYGSIPSWLRHNLIEPSVHLLPEDAAC